MVEGIFREQWDGEQGVHLLVNALPGRHDGKSVTQSLQCLSEPPYSQIILSQGPSRRASGTLTA